MLTTLALEGHTGTSVDIDVCKPCRAFWFDRHESLQLSPRATLSLFSLIGDQVTTARLPLGSVLKCPRCGSRLLQTQDRQRNTAFRYWRCPHDHGRLITYFDFLREKNFIKPLSQEQIDELRRKLRTVNCSNCGAPVDLAHRTICEHCDSPLSMVEWKAPE